MNANISNVKVEMYYKHGCPYCIRARDLLLSKGVNIVEYAAAGEQNIFAEMQRRANGGRTFPQIFIADQHIGGCDDLHALEAAGELDNLLSSK